MVCHKINVVFQIKSTPFCFKFTFFCFKFTYFGNLIYPCFRAYFHRALTGYFAVVILVTEEHVP